MRSRELLYDFIADTEEYCKNVCQNISSGYQAVAESSPIVRPEAEHGGVRKDWFVSPRVLGWQDLLSWRVAGYQYCVLGFWGPHFILWPSVFLVWDLFLLDDFLKYCSRQSW